jgi:hypothetical protein
LQKRSFEHGWEQSVKPNNPSCKTLLRLLRRWHYFCATKP